MSHETSDEMEQVPPIEDVEQSMCWTDQWCHNRLAGKVLIFAECASAKSSPAFVPVSDLVGVCKLAASVATVVNDQIDARNWFN